MAWLKYRKADGTWAKLKAIRTADSFNTKIVTELPTTDISENTIYLVPSENPETPDSYDEYIYVNSAWERLGTRSETVDTVADETVDTSDIGDLF